MSAGRAWTLEEVEVAVQRGVPEAAQAIEWFWRNGDMFEKHGAFVERARSWCTRPELREAIERLRPATPVRVEKVFPGLMDWLALTEALGRDAEILHWFDAQRAAGELQLPPMSRLQKAVLRRGRLGDVLAFGDPLESIQDLVESLGTMKERLADFPPEILEMELEQTDAELAHWYVVARAECPGQLPAIDAQIDRSGRAAAVRAWLDRPLQTLVHALFDR